MLRRAAHHAVRVSADIPHADVIAPDDEDVGFLVCADAGPATSASTAINANNMEHTFTLYLIFFLLSQT